MNARSVLGRPLPKYTLVYSDESICLYGTISTNNMQNTYIEAQLMLLARIISQSYAALTVTFNCVTYFVTICAMQATCKL
jgi:hypothetical protein